MVTAPAATSTSLLDRLASDLVAWLDSADDTLPRGVLLWLDPERQFSRLAPRLEPALAARGTLLLCYDPEARKGQLALKLALLELESDADHEKRAVAYLPGFARDALEPRPDGGAPALWGLYEYRYKGCVWGRGPRCAPGSVPEPYTLLTWLGRHGVRAASDKDRRQLTADGSRSLLARYAERECERDPTDWPQPLRVSDVHARLAGEAHARLRQLLAAPNNEVRTWGEDAPVVLAKLAEEYGLVAPESGADDPEALADACAVTLGLAEAWDALGQSKDFPFLARLPESLEHRKRLAAFLRTDVLPHAELGPRYRERIGRLEHDYPLAGWARGRKGHPAGLPRLSRARWEELLASVTEAGTRHPREAVNLLRAARGDLLIANERAPHEDTPWHVLLDLLDLAETSADAVAEAPGMAQLVQFVDAYTERWWRADKLHLQVLADCSRTPGLEAVRRVAGQVYSYYAEKVNERFSTLVEREGVWPPPGTDGIASIRPVLWKARAGRSAIIISDACRWDLAMLLAERLDERPTVRPVLTTLPSETPFGMTALLPLGDDLPDVEVAKDGVQIRFDGLRLEDRIGRKAFLAATLAGKDGRAGIEFVDMEDLLRGAPVPATSIVAVFDNATDEIGHKGTAELPALFEHFANQLRRTIQRLHEAGIATVQLVTDHGFLLLPPEEVENVGKPEVTVAQANRRSTRWTTLKDGVGTDEVFPMPMPLDPAQKVWFTRGIRTLFKADEYLHGGISLQECVIPYLVSQVQLAPSRVGVEVTVSTTSLTGGTVPVILRVAPLAIIQQTLGGIQPITVKLWVETDDGVAAAEPVEVLVKPDAGELRPPVYLREGLGLTANQSLRLRSIDRETGQDLGSVPLTLLVDWE